MEYREYEPPPDLRATVHCLWTMEGSVRELQPDVQAVLPDGRPELVLHLGDSFERMTDDGTFERQATLLFAGQLTSQLVLRPTGRIAVAAVRFRADGAAEFLKVPQADFAGRTGALQDVSASLHERLSEVRSETDSPQAAIKLLLERLVPVLQDAVPDPRISYVVDAIAMRKGLVSIEKLATQVGMTRRHLERRFQVAVGISPKRLARVTRFQHALTILEQSDGRHRGSRTAAECGYADQAHFIREFRELAGCAPGAHLIQRGEVTGFFMQRFSRSRSD